MPEQSTFADIDGTPRLTDRLFFAIFPDKANAIRIAQLTHQLRAQLGLLGKPLAENRLHVTLQYLGDHSGLPQELITRAIQAAATVEMPAFEIVFNHILSFSRKRHNRPLVLCGDEGVIAIALFQRQLGNALQRLGLGRWVAPIYTPHLTLLYDDRCITTQAVDEISWIAREFVLVHSLLGQSQHVPLARWPLYI